MTTFEFVVDRELRKSLESDWAELNTAFENECWKSVHVLAGSIIEALLVDYLLSTDHCSKDPLKMTLDQAVEAAKNDGVLSGKTVDLCTVIRHYRNLIHPGKAHRLGECPDRQSSTVCQALVLMISGEVATSRRRTYGYTAEQIASKLERDPSALSIMSQILKMANPVEIERLLLEVIPSRHFEIYTSDFQNESGHSLENCFHSAFEVARDDVKGKVANRFVRILHEEDGGTVLWYERVFFRPTYLAYLSEGDQNTVKTHLLDQLRAGSSNELFLTCGAIGRFLRDDEISDFVDSAVRPLMDMKKKWMHRGCEAFLSGLFISLPDGSDKKVTDRLSEWVSRQKALGRSEDAQRLQSLIDLIDVPF